MAIRKESGKPYSKVVNKTFGVDELAQAYAELRTVKPFLERVDDVVENARAFLADRGIPGCAQLYQSRQTGNYTCAKPADVGGWCALDNYVVKHLGLKRDSFEHLAARVVVTADAMQRRDGEHALAAAFELGTLEILSRAYAAESRQGRSITSKDKRKPWAIAAKEKITSWDDIPTDPDNPLVILGAHGEYRIFRDGNEVFCHHHHKNGVTEKSLKKRSFIRGYLIQSE